MAERILRSIGHGQCIGGSSRIEYLADARSFQPFGHILPRPTTWEEQASLPLRGKSNILPIGAPSGQRAKRPEGRRAESAKRLLPFGLLCLMRSPKGRAHTAPLGAGKDTPLGIYRDTPGLKQRGPFGVTKKTLFCLPAPKGAVCAPRIFVLRSSGPEGASAYCTFRCWKGPFGGTKKPTRLKGQRKVFSALWAI